MWSSLTLLVTTPSAPQGPFPLVARPTSPQWSVVDDPPSLVGGLDVGQHIVEVRWVEAGTALFIVGAHRAGPDVVEQIYQISHCFRWANSVGKGRGKPF